MRISDYQHNQFILCSLDDNNIHADIAVAESLGANSRIIHGIHQVILVISRLSLNESEIREFKFNFIKPLSANQDFKISCSRVDDKIHFSIEDSITQFTSGYFSLSEQSDSSDKKTEKTIELMKNRSLPKDFSESVKFDLKKLSSIYPRITTSFTPEFLRRLLYVSFYFGVTIRSENMVIISVQFKATHTLEENNFETEIKRSGQAQTLKMDFGGKRLLATGRKFNYFNPRYSNLTSNTNLGRYGGQKALIFGGTGSLGSTISKILIRDQSQVNVTYKSLKKLNSVFDNKFENLIPWEYDLDSTNFPDIEGITHIYYLISPRIFLSNKPAFSRSAYDEFHRCYVIKIEEIIKKYSKGPLEFVFSPSTIAINHPSFQLKEYIKAKQEMEKKLLELSIHNSNLTISFPRLEEFESMQTINLPRHLKKLPQEIAFRYLPFTS